MLKDYNLKEELTEEELVNDMDFLRDASTFLSGRQGFNEAISPDEIYTRFMEHMRFQDVNEITALRDLEYAQNAELGEKLAFGRLIDAYDKVNEGFSSRMALDYAEGVLKAPSTYVGIATGGTGKAASMAGTQVAKLGVRKILAEGLRSATRAAGVEGAIGAGQGAVQEATRVETGVQSEFTGGRTAMTGLASAATAGLLNFPLGTGIPGLTKGQARKASEADELYEKAQLASAQKANSANTKSKQVLANANASKVKAVKETLDALDPNKVKIGRMLKKNLAKGETMTTALGTEVVENISAAAIRIKDKLQIGDKERVTSAIANLITKGQFTDLQSVRRILDEHNLTADQFSLVYLAEISDAGKTLGSQSRISKALRPKTEADVMIEELDQLERAGQSGFTSTDALDLRKGLNIIKDLDTLRLGTMTSQPATTMRNNLNGGMRMAVDAATRTMDNILNLRNPLDGTFDVFKYAFNPYEAKVMQKLFTEAMPNEASTLFREAADIVAKTGKEGALAIAGRKINYFNTLSDNFFKRAVLSASLKRRLKDDGKDLYKIIENAEWNTIPEDILKGAIQDAYEFTYQSAIKSDGLFGRIGKGVINLHKDAPFLISSFIPFPRYIANQMKFINEHMPILGLLQLDRFGAKSARPEGYLKERIAKQLTGTMLLSSAYMWRLQQGDTAHWYDIQTNDGNTIDGRAVYGPFAPFMLVADLIYRYQKGTMPTNINTYVRDTLQATLGSTFRAGLGLYTLDKLYTDLGGLKGQKIIGESLGNLMNTFTLPVAVVKDFYGQFDPLSRQIPETNLAVSRLEGKGASQTVNWFDIMMLRGTRAFPDFPFNDYDIAAVSPFQTGNLKAIHPIEKQLFGFGMREGKNPLQEEMARLGLTPYDIYRKPQNETLDLYTRQYLAEEDSDLNLNENMELFLDSKEYNLPNLSAEEKRVLLTDEAKKIINKARKEAVIRIGAEDSILNLPYNELDLIEFQGLSAKERDAVNAIYQRDFGGKNVIKDRDKTIIINGQLVNVMRWAAETSKTLN